MVVGECACANFFRRCTRLKAAADLLREVRTMELVNATNQDWDTPKTIPATIP